MLSQCSALSSPMVFSGNIGRFCRSRSFTAWETSRSPAWPLPGGSQLDSERCSPSDCSSFVWVQAASNRASQQTSVISSANRISICSQRCLAGFIFRLTPARLFLPFSVHGFVRNPSWARAGRSEFPASQNRHRSLHHGLVIRRDRLDSRSNRCWNEAEHQLAIIGLRDPHTG